MYNVIVNYYMSIKKYIITLMKNTTSKQIVITIKYEIKLDEDKQNDM